MRPITCLVRCAPPIVLMLAVTPTAVFAQSLVCQEIGRGESAVHAAWRITGDGRNAYQAWFQIMNPSSRFVPKSQYDRVRAGWRACVVKRTIVGRAPLTANHFKAAEAAGPSDASHALVASKALVAAAPHAAAKAVAAGEALKRVATSPQLMASGVLRAIGRVDLTMVWLGAAMVVPWFGWRILDEYLARTKTMTFVMRHFADRFVCEFERPLVRYHAADHPVRSRLRCSPRKERFDILLAPGKGRRYPNLADHKRNVEYDVARVMRVVADASFVSGPVYTQAGWVVVPFRFLVRRRGWLREPAGERGTADPKQAGVTCISSF